MANRYVKKRQESQNLAKERIVGLFEQAEAVFDEYPAYATRYVSLARKLSTKYKVRIPQQWKRRYCKHCSTFLVPSVNCRIRVSGGKLVYFCMSCKHFMRFPYIHRR